MKALSETQKAFLRHVIYCLAVQYLKYFSHLLLPFLLNILIKQNLQKDKESKWYRNVTEGGKSCLAPKWSAQSYSNPKRINRAPPGTRVLWYHCSIQECPPGVVSPLIPSRLPAHIYCSMARESSTVVNPFSTVEQTLPTWYPSTHL